MGNLPAAPFGRPPGSSSDRAPSSCPSVTQGSPLIRFATRPLGRAVAEHAKTHQRDSVESVRGNCRSQIGKHPIRHARRGAWPCRAGGPHPAQRLRAGDTFETKRAAHRFYGYQDAIAQRSSPGLAFNRSTVKPLSPPPRHLHQVPTDASVTIRLLILTPAQRVSRI